MIIHWFIIENDYTFLWREMHYKYNLDFIESALYTYIFIGM